MLKWVVGTFGLVHSLLLSRGIERKPSKCVSDFNELLCAIVIALIFIPVICLWPSEMTVRYSQTLNVPVISFETLWFYALSADCPHKFDSQIFWTEINCNYFWLLFALGGLLRLTGTITNELCGGIQERGWIEHCRYSIRYVEALVYDEDVAPFAIIFSLLLLLLLPFLHEFHPIKIFMSGH